NNKSTKIELKVAQVGKHGARKRQVGFRQKKNRQVYAKLVDFGRSVGIRTPGLLDPNQARYQTSPHPGKALPLYSSPQGMSSTGAGKIPRHISPSGPIEMGQNDTERGHPHG